MLIRFREHESQDRGDMMFLLRPIYKFYEWKLEKNVKRGKIPEHIGIIMDGNRRLAKYLGLAPWDGHRMGAEKLKEVLRWCYDLGIKTVTAYAFSMENFMRPKKEIEKLFDLFEEYFSDIAEDAEIHQKKVRIKAIGRVYLFPERVKKAIEKAEKATKHYKNFKLNLALAYGGRQEVIDAVKKIAKKVKEGEICPEEINEKIFSENLYTSDCKDPDLIIRTSGEERISGFLLWQSAYAEFYFCETYWPRFRKIDLLRAIRTYQQRERRFGR